MCVEHWLLHRENSLNVLLLFRESKEWTRSIYMHMEVSWKTLYWVKKKKVSELNTHYDN